MRQKEYPYQNLSLKDMKGEEWEDIPGVEGYFRVSKYGRIKRLKREFVNKRGFLVSLTEKIIAPRVMRTPNTYVSDYTYQLSAHFTAEGKKYYIPVRRLVYYCFVAPFDLTDDTILIVSKKGWGLDIHPYNLLLIQKGDLIHRVIKKNRITLEFRTPDIHRIGMLASLKYTSKQITQYSTKGKKIKTYSSTMEASRKTAISNSQIRNAAVGNERSAGGYFWLYGNAKSFDVNFFIANRKISYKEKKGVRVSQYDLKGNLVGKYLTLTDAAKALKAKSYMSISSVIKDKNHTALGYIWKAGWGKAKIDTKTLLKRRIRNYRVKVS